MKKFMITILLTILAQTVIADTIVTCKTEKFDDSEYAENQGQFAIRLQFSNAGEPIGLVILKGSHPTTGADSNVDSPALVFSNSKVKIYNIENSELGDQTYYNPRLIVYRSSLKSVVITHGYSTDDGPIENSRYTLSCR